MKKKNIQALTEIIDGKLMAVASDNSVDRMGDSLDADRWDLKNFKKNPVLLAGHDYRPEYVIGVAKNIKVEGEKLMFEPEFHDFTELAKNMAVLVKNQILKAWSVGFIPNALLDPENKSAKNELLEISLVAVPANANALMVEAKSYSSETKTRVNEWVEKKTKKIKKAKKKSPEFKIEDKIKKEIITTETGETNNHTHSAKYNSENGEGTTAQNGDKLHLHIITNFKIEESNNHTHTLKKSEKKEIQKKEGKVISKRNRQVISEAIDATKNVVIALEKLLDLSEERPEKAIEDIKKVVKKESVQELPISEKELVRQILRKIAGSSNLALNKLKK